MESVSPALLRSDSSMSGANRDNLTHECQFTQFDNNSSPCTQPFTAEHHQELHSPLQKSRIPLSVLYMINECIPCALLPPSLTLQSIKSAHLITFIAAFYTYFDLFSQQQYLHNNNIPWWLLHSVITFVSRVNCQFTQSKLVAVEGVQYIHMHLILAVHIFILHTPTLYIFSFRFIHLLIIIIIFNIFIVINNDIINTFVYFYCDIYNLFTNYHLSLL